MAIVSKLGNSLDMSSSSAESLENGSDVRSWLHRDDSELILLVNPDKESLGVVVENTSTRWPVSVEVASIEEPVSLLEEEVIVNELLLILGTHTLKWVELSFEVTLESVASSHDLVHDLKSLGLGDTWTERVVSEVSSDSDSCRVDHSRLLWSEIGVLKTIGSHIGHVHSVFVVLVVVQDNLIEELGELGVSIVRSGIDTDTRILVSNTRENAGLESYTLRAALVLVLLPDFFGEALLALRFGALLKELVEVDKIGAGLIALVESEL